VISVALRTPLEIRLGKCMCKTSLLHRPDDYIGFTPSCPPHLQQNCAHEYDTVMGYGVVPLAHSVKDRKAKNTSCSMFTGLLSVVAGSENIILFLIVVLPAHVFSGSSSSLQSISAFDSVDQKYLAIFYLKLCISYLSS